MKSPETDEKKPIISCVKKSLRDSTLNFDSMNSHSGTIEKTINLIELIY